MCAVCVVCLVCLVCVLMYKKKKGKAVDPEKLCLCMPTLIRKLVTRIKKFRNVPYTKNPSRYWYIIIRDYLTDIARSSISLPFHQKCLILLLSEQ